jgi:hypothetical protein
MNNQLAATDSDVHIAAIRRALRNGNAAVMVGAGFSRNAEGGDKLGTWKTLAEELARELEPVGGSVEQAISNVTQLAEQYARVFSTPELEMLLHRMIPDQQVAPGALHLNLLGLPWSEIFTTNYDTLLERTATKIVERAHFTVCSREDIPQSKILGRRRIVKLHGSFPSQRPFIFTEEDYRTYPQRFAPFVNLVRQSLLENVFCLIGFSGDDPNFLHWLGWVRDMLDKHALPVYLFLDNPPSLGQRKLLEARGVTPVMLPALSEKKNAKFSDRYAELFRQLAEPTKSPAVEWGQIAWPKSVDSFPNSEAERYGHFLSLHPALAKEKKKYPGWMVAPAKVRKQFSISLNRMHSTVEYEWVRVRLESENPAIVVAVLGLYAWQNDILLHPMLDKCGEASLTALYSATAIDIDSLSMEQKAFLASLEISSQAEFSRCWTELALATLRWARQEMLVGDFMSLAECIESHSGKDSAAADAILYEKILLELYSGDRSAAKQLLQNWRVKSIDPYMQVRKAAVCAELGETETALTLCREVIQRLRDMQRMQPEDELLISLEAWACLIGQNIQRGISFVNRVTGSIEIDHEIQGLNDRLRILAAHGYSPRDDMEELECALNAEASLPTEAKYRFGGFDLGYSSGVERFGATSEFRSKVNAAFAWLELVDRVGLMTRVGRVTFYVDSFLQAAWWAQYSDSQQRVLSVLFRTAANDALKPRDDDQPKHKTGWLSRYQVAKMSAESAALLCDRFMSQLEAHLTGPNATDDAGSTQKFFADAFSRLVVRVERPDLVIGWGRRIVKLHKVASPNLSSDVWRVLAIALARCVEALPPQDQAVLLRDVTNIPLVPPDGMRLHFASDWVNVLGLLDWVGKGDGAASVWEEEYPNIEELLQIIENSKVDDLTGQLAWARLIWLKELRAISDENQRRVSTLLWRGNETWPVIPGFLPVATFAWPSPPDLDIHEIFRHWALKMQISSFSSMTKDPLISDQERRAWSFPVDDRALKAFLYLSRHSTWDDRDILVAAERIKRWWDSEGSYIRAAMPTISGLESSISARMNRVDEVMAAWLRASLESGRSLEEKVPALISEIAQSFIDEGFLLWRTQIYLAGVEGDAEEFVRLQLRLTSALFGSTESALPHAYAAAQWVIERGGTRDIPSADLLIDSLIAVLSSRRMPSLIWALDVLAHMLKNGKTACLHAERFRTIEVGLELLFEELNYHTRPPATGIDDDALPLLRYRCATLSYVLSQSSLPTSPVVTRWLEAAKVDPLPELRLMRFKQ